MINCPECGAENRPEASFCTECGAELTVQPMDSEDLTPVEPVSSDDDATILSSRRELEEALTKARSESAPPPILEPDFREVFGSSPASEPETLLGSGPSPAPGAEPFSQPPPPPLIEPKTEPQKSNRVFTIVAAVLAAILSCPCICGVIIAAAYISDPAGFEDLLILLFGG